MAGTSDTQDLSKTCEMVARAKTELWHRILTHHLPLYLPEADRFHRSSYGVRFLAFPEAFPSARMIIAMNKVAFMEAAWPVIGRRVGKAALLADIGGSFLTPQVMFGVVGETVLGLFPDPPPSARDVGSRLEDGGGGLAPSLYWLMEETTS